MTKILIKFLKGA